MLISNILHLKGSESFSIISFAFLGPIKFFAGDVPDKFANHFMFCNNLKSSDNYPQFVAINSTSHFCASSVAFVILTLVAMAKKKKDEDNVVTDN